MNYRALLSASALAVALSFSSTSSGHDLPLTTPHDFSREIAQLDVSAYTLTLEQDETVDFAAEGINRVTIDDAGIVGASEDESADRLILTARKSGKAVVRVFWSNKDVTMDHEKRHGVGMFVTTIIVNVRD